MKAVSILSNFRGVTYTEQCLPGKGLGRSPSVKKSGGKKSRWIVPFMYLPLYIAQQQMVWNSASRTCIFFPWPEKTKLYQWFYSATPVPVPFQRHTGVGVQANLDILHTAPHLSPHPSCSLSYSSPLSFDFKRPFFSNYSIFFSSLPQ